MAHVCSFCDSNGFRQQLPRLKLAWYGWKSTPAYDGLLQMMSDDDGLYFLCNDCEISYAFSHWLIHGIWQFPQDVRV